MTEDVTLIGGWFDGETREVDVTRKVITESAVLEVIDRDGWIDGEPLFVSRLVVATYRRLDRNTFVHCRTPTGIGDRGFDLPEVQLRIEVEDDD